MTNRFKLKFCKLLENVIKYALKLKSCPLFFWFVFQAFFVGELLMLSAWVSGLLFIIGITY